jgi:alkyl sulfatase BDS1-like metallo-beta-lactamase superfamily hydrolase
MERISHLNRFAAILVALLAAAQAPAATSPTTSNAASANTQAANAKVLSLLPFNDNQDFEDAQRGKACPCRRPGKMRQHAASTDQRFESYSANVSDEASLVDLLATFKRELAVAMALTGAKSISELHRGLIE